MYTEKEINNIQKVIARREGSGSGKRILLSTNITQREGVPHHLRRLAPLLEENPALYDKIAKDRQAEKFGIFGFFPKVVDWVYGSETSPKVVYIEANRGRMAVISNRDVKLVIKPADNSREHGISKKAGKLGVGPGQFETLEGFMVEEFIRGDLFTHLRKAMVEKSAMLNMGRRLGEILSLLHKNGICYNDTTLSEDSGNSNFIVPATGPAMLIDYGFALNLGNFPHFNNEELYSYVRTMPGVSSMFEAGISKGKLHRLMRKHRDKLETLTKENINERDVYYVVEGAYFASAQYGEWVAPTFLSGFWEAYAR